MQRDDNYDYQHSNNIKQQNHVVLSNQMPLTVSPPENKFGINNTTQRFSPNISRFQRRSKLSR